MKLKETQQMFLACFASFLAVALLGSWIFGGDPASPVFTATSKPQATAAPSAAPAHAPTPAPSFASSAPQPPAVSQFSFTGAEFFERLRENIGQGFQLEGSFVEGKVYISWAAVGKESNSDDPYWRIACYSQSEGGAVEAVSIRKYGWAFSDEDVQADAFVQALHLCSGFKDISPIVRSLQNKNSYTAHALRAVLDGEGHCTISAPGSSLQTEVVNAVSWKDMSVLASGSKRYAQLQTLNSGYHYSELVEVLEAVPEEQRTQDEIWGDSLGLARLGARLQEKCTLDDSLSSAPVLYYEGLTKIEEQCSFVPYLTKGKIGLLAGFYDGDELPFTSIKIASGELYITLNCDTNTVTPQSTGQFLKSSEDFFINPPILRSIADMEAPIAYFFSSSGAQIGEHVFTENEKSAFRTFYALSHLENRLQRRCKLYSFLTLP